MSARTIVPNPAITARSQKSATNGIPVVRVSQPNPQIEEPPQWARQILSGIENLNSRVGLIESGSIRPSFSEVASDVSDGGVSLQAPPAIPMSVRPANQDWQTVISQRTLKSPPQPRMGESGSGYTLLPNGKTVRNKRPAHKPLTVRQAINWRSNATTELVSFLKERGIGKSDPKPASDLVYLQLVESLAKAKAYYVYSRLGGTQEVHVWREAHKNDIMSLPLEEDSQSWADEMSEVASQPASEEPANPEHPTSGPPPEVEANAPKAIGQISNKTNRITVFPGARSEISPSVAEALAKYAQKHEVQSTVPPKKDGEAPKGPSK
jgi:hypothetical protein